VGKFVERKPRGIAGRHKIRHTRGLAFCGIGRAEPDGLRFPTMDILNHPAIAHIAVPVSPVAKPPHELEAENFRNGLRTIYETLQHGLEKDEEIAAFYGNIRVYHIKMLSNCVLTLDGEDETNTHVIVAGHFTSIHLIYTKLKLTPEKKPKPIGFSVAE